jgi:hypothetical protein
MLLEWLAYLNSERNAFIFLVLAHCGKGGTESFSELVSAIWYQSQVTFCCMDLVMVLVLYIFMFMCILLSDLLYFLSELCNV